MAKKILFLVALMLALACMMVSCGNGGSPLHTHSYGEWSVRTNSTCEAEGVEFRTCACGSEETRAIPINKGHTDLESQIRNSSCENEYSELYSIYQNAMSHKADCNCNLAIDELLENMLFGEWKNTNGDYITYTYAYEDYYNEAGQTWYGTNLTTSKLSGNTYYYYTKTAGNKLVIGYKDKLTEDRTDNFFISFHENSISVENKNNGITYTLTLNANYDKVQKGNAKTAYVYIAKHIFDYKVPSSVKVTQCYVDYDEKIVYATIQASNSFGGTISEKYKLYMIGNSYYIDEYSHSYSTNIDLTELNQKLQNYVSSGG